jgi:phosphopantothenoylcysteine decarboxylase/phosphopantothenate--cysteine ligase
MSKSASNNLVQDSKFKVLVLMTGSIACYKACHILSKLQQLKNFEVKVVASKAALQFVGPATLEGLTSQEVFTDEVYTLGKAMDHIHLIREADLILVAPATANFINKMAQGLGDDLLSTLFLAHDFKKPFLVAPAMNTAMYQHPITQSSLKKLSDLGLLILETEAGVLACGEVGLGKLLDPDLIVEKILQNLKGSQKISPLQNLNILITSGGTKEPIDEVRFISNFSTGSTGAQLAEELLKQGCNVTLIHAKDSVQPKWNGSLAQFNKKSYFSFKDLESELKYTLDNKSFDYVIHCAAVSDFSIEKIEGREDPQAPLLSRGGKISSQGALKICLKPNPKLIHSIKDWSLNKKVKVLGFKLNSNANLEQIEGSVKKLFEPQLKVDWVVANDLSEIKGHEHPFKIYQQDLQVSLQGKSKQDLSQKIIELFQTELIKKDKELT